MPECNTRKPSSVVPVLKGSLKLKTKNLKFASKKSPEFEKSYCRNNENVDADPFFDFVRLDLSP